jgi:hypothetical protein
MMVSFVSALGQFFFLLVVTILVVLSVTYKIDQIMKKIMEFPRC